ncbi:hypothetical protein R6Q57_011889 [Mikania cordata]
MAATSPFYLRRLLIAYSKESFKFRESKMDNQQPKKEEQKLEEGLPAQLIKSPYTQYKDLEDYKMKGYGTHGHQQPKPGRGAAASTDAPTSGGGSDIDPSTATATDTINKYGVS